MNDLFCTFHTKTDLPYPYPSPEMECFIKDWCDLVLIDSDHDYFVKKLKVCKWLTGAGFVLIVGHFVALAWSSKKLKSVQGLLDEADEAEETEDTKEKKNE